jgi:hypothetical protein
MNESQSSDPCNVDIGAYEHMKKAYIYIYLLILTAIGQKEKDHWKVQDVGGWTILKLILER